MERAVIPDLVARSGETATIRSRVLRTWGLAESTLAELVASRFERSKESPARRPSPSWPAGWTASRCGSRSRRVGTEAAESALDAEESALRAVLGDIVFGVDDDTMESVVGSLLVGRGLTLGVAESLTGGLVGARLTAVPGASEWFRGSIVSYASDVKRSVLDVPAGPVVSAEAATAMATGAARVLGADVGLGVTGVAGPAEQEGMAVGTVFCGVSIGGSAEVRELHLPGDRERVRWYSTITVLDLLRRTLLTAP